jgi:oligoribonuclease (3'-5' exoribonuclease)
MGTDLLPLCWIDLETTGLAHTDPVLEVACILTTPDMETELGSFQQVVQPDLYPSWGIDGHRFYPSTWRRDMDDVVVQMHGANGLMADVEASVHDLWTVGCTIDRMMGEQWDGKWRLAGSGVAAFDLHVLRHQVPDIPRRFHYAPLDVGQVRRFLEYARRDDLVANELTLDGNAGSHELHRAMADLRLHLAEARTYRDLFVGGLRSLQEVARRRLTER